MPIVKPREDIDERLQKTKNYISGMNRRKETKTGAPKISIGFASDMLEEVEKLPTGIDTLDMRLGGGLPLGKVVVVYGGKSSTKTTGTYKIIQTATEYGFRCKRYDAERQDDRIWMNHVGVPLDKLGISPENRFSRVWDAIYDEIDNDAFDVFIIDSMDILLHDAVERKTTGEDHMTLTARKLSQIVMPKIISRLADTKKLLIVVCQARSDVGGSSLDGYSGGNALQHDSSLDLWFRRAGQSKERSQGGRFKPEGGRAIGFPAAVRIMKSRLYGVTEGAEAKYDFYFGQGINREKSVFEEAYRLGRVQQGGAKFTIVNEKGAELISAQGAETVAERLKSDTKLLEKVIDSLSKESVEIQNIEEAEADVSEVTEEEKQEEKKRKQKTKSK